jgi:hypothetical protein
MRIWSANPQFSLEERRAGCEIAEDQIFCNWDQEGNKWGKADSIFAKVVQIIK